MKKKQLPLLLVGWVAFCALVGGVLEGFTHDNNEAKDRWLLGALDGISCSILIPLIMMLRYFIEIAFRDLTQGLNTSTNSYATFNTILQVSTSSEENAETNDTLLPFETELLMFTRLWQTVSSVGQRQNNPHQSGSAISRPGSSFV